MKPKLIIIDCDGVLYEPHELDINAVIYAFNDYCDACGQTADKVNRIENSTHDKPVRGFFNYMKYLAERDNIPFEAFVARLIQRVDYSAIAPDTKNMLHALKELTKKVPVCFFTNNHLQHFERVLNAKLNIGANELPCPVFDVCYTFFDGRFNNKESAFAVNRLAQQFNTPAERFLWLDDSEKILNTVAQYGCQGRLINTGFSLSDALWELNKNL